MSSHPSPANEIARPCSVVNILTTTRQILSFLGLEHSGTCFIIWGFCVRRTECRRAKVVLVFSPDRFLKTFMKAPLILDPPTSMMLARPPTTRVTSAAPLPGQTGSCGGGRGTLLTGQVREMCERSEVVEAARSIVQRGSRSHSFSAARFAI